MSTTEGERDSLKKDVRFSLTEEEEEMAKEKARRKEKEARVSISDDNNMEKEIHSLFVQMNVLNEEGTTWKEQNRWLVYEEKLEDSDRWSKPHMPTTSFVALEEVRKAFEERTLALHLDTDCGCLRKIMDDFSVVIAQHEKLDDDTRKKMLAVLRKPHIKGYDQNIINKNKPNVSLQKKMAKGSEAANILVGRVDFIEEPIIAFARLSQAEDLSDITEVHLPTKFVFLVLSPKDCHVPANYYEEIGRSMAQLLTDKIFPQVVYKAKKRQHLLEGIDEFKSQLTVLPPSIWDPNTRLDPVEEKIEMEEIKKRIEKRRWSVSLSIERQQSQDRGDEGYQDSSLQRTGRLFGGMIDDIKRRYNRRVMLSDYKDALHLQSLASIIFLYFACITPIITFGGLLGVATDNYMGTMETIMSGALCGTIYALFAGQPLTIVGATGPLLVFETLLYSFCKDHGLNFLPFRFWIGAWVLLYLLIVVALDLSALIRFITRFTEECFATLVSVIFIYSAIKKLSKIWKTHPIHSHAVDESVDYTCHCEHPPASNATIGNGTALIHNATYHPSDHKMFEEHDWEKLVYEDCITYQHRIIVDAQCITETECTEHGWLLVGPACNVFTVTHSIPDVFLLSIILCVGTYLVAAFFRDLRHTNYLTYTVRNLLSDFAIFLGIVICTVVDMLLAVDTPKLTVPDKIKNTRDDRGWFVNPMEVSEWWHALVAAAPALLAAVLIFLDQQITAVIVNRKQHKLKKGHGYHLDLFVIAFLVFICSFMGIPWFVAATVAAITHVSTLRMVSEVTAPGEKPVFIGAREQRVTGLVTHILIGISVFLTGILKHIPMAVLYGVFLYMGINSLSGMQFVDRILLLFSPKKYQADLPYLRRVTMKKVHLFTLAQILCFIVLWVFKSVKAIALLFPLMILGPAVVRVILERWYTQEELYWLDEVLPPFRRRRRSSTIDVNDLTDEDILMENGNIKLKENEPKRNAVLRTLLKLKNKKRHSSSNPVEMKPLNDESNDDSNRNSISKHDAEA